VLGKVAAVDVVQRLGPSDAESSWVGSEKMDPRQRL